MANNREALRQLYEQSKAAGYSPSETAHRLRVFMQTGQVPDDPTDKVWDALIQQESGGRQNAISPKGAVGVAQVMPTTAPEAAAMAGVPFDEEAYRNDPQYNARLGRAYLRSKFQEFGGDPVLALAAYNAGSAAVKKAGGDLSRLPTETQQYVPSILGNMKEAPMDARRAQAKQIYDEMVASGADPGAIKARIQQEVYGMKAPVAQVNPDTPEDTSAALQALGAPNPLPNGGLPLQAPPQQAEPDAAPDTTDPFTKYMAGLYRAGQSGEAGQVKAVADAIRGIRQLYNRATGDTETLNRLMQEEQASRRIEQQYNPEGSGISRSDIGNLAANIFGIGGVAGGLGGAVTHGVAGALPMVGPTLANVLGGATAGAVQGAAVPVANQQESQGLNAATGAIVGGAIPALGGALRAFAGRASPEMAQTAETLRGQGVEVPRGFDYEGFLPRVIRERDIVPDNVNASVSNAIGARLGMAPGTPLTNQALETQKQALGQQIGQFYQGTQVQPGASFIGRLSDIDQAYRQTGAARPNDDVSRMIRHLAEWTGSGQPIPGEAYQAMRSEMTAKTKLGGAMGNAYRGLRDALDDLFISQVPQADREAYQALNRQYRLASLMRKGAGGGDMDAPLQLKQLASRLESGVAGGRVDTGTRQLLSDLLRTMPTALRPVEKTALAADLPGSITQLFLWPLNFSLRNVVAPAVRSGAPQALLNNPATPILSHMLRVYGTKEAARMKERNDAP